MENAQKDTIIKTADNWRAMVDAVYKLFKSRQSSLYIAGKLIKTKTNKYNEARKKNERL